MPLRQLEPRDVDWVVQRLAQRRQALVSFAPVYWRPASDAEARHREFLEYLVGEGGAIGFRTDDDLILAQPRGAGWMVDDAAVAEDKWETDGSDLWNALRNEISGSVRWVCPTPEPQRRAFVADCGFKLTESWWYRSVDAEMAVAGDVTDVSIIGASARLVPAPPVYAPGGAVLFLTNLESPDEALADSIGNAAAFGSPIIVVSQPPEEDALAAKLSAAGFKRHCDFLEGDV